MSSLLGATAACLKSTGPRLGRRDRLDTPSPEVASFIFAHLVKTATPHIGPLDERCTLARAATRSTGMGDDGLSLVPTGSPAKCIMRNKCTYLHTRVVLNRTNTRTHWRDQPQELSRALAPRVLPDARRWHQPPELSRALTSRVPPDTLLLTPTPTCAFAELPRKVHGPVVRCMATYIRMAAKVVFSTYKRLRNPNPV